MPLPQQPRLVSFLGAMPPSAGARPAAGSAAGSSLILEETGKDFLIAPLSSGELGGQARSDGAEGQEAGLEPPQAQTPPASWSEGGTPPPPSVPDCAVSPGGRLAVLSEAGFQATPLASDVIPLHARQ